LAVSLGKEEAEEMSANSSLKVIIKMAKQVSSPLTIPEQQTKKQQPTNLLFADAEREANGSVSYSLLFFLVIVRDQIVELWQF
jgi:hypothetical protein